MQHAHTAYTTYIACAIYIGLQAIQGPGSSIGTQPIRTHAWPGLARPAQGGPWVLPPSRSHNVGRRGHPRSTERKARWSGLTSAADNALLHAMRYNIDSNRPGLEKGTTDWALIGTVGRGPNSLGLGRAVPLAFNRILNPRCAWPCQAKPQKD